MGTVSMTKFKPRHEYYIYNLDKRGIFYLCVTFLSGAVSAVLEVTKLSVHNSASQLPGHWLPALVFATVSFSLEVLNLSIRTASDASACRVATKVVVPIVQSLLPSRSGQEGIRVHPSVVNSL